MNEIKIGDIIRHNDTTPKDDCDYAICTYIRGDLIYVMHNDGSSSNENKCDWHCTGVHICYIPEMLQLLKSMEGVI